MSENRKADRGLHERTIGWGFGFIAVAFGLFFVIDDTDPESVARLPAILSFVTLVVGKGGLLITFVGVGIVLVFWDVYVAQRADRPDPAAERDSKQPVRESQLPFAVEIDDRPLFRPAGPIKGRGPEAGAFRRGQLADSTTGEHGTTRVVEEVAPPAQGYVGGGVALSTAKYLGRK